MRQALAVDRQADIRPDAIQHICGKLGGVLLRRWKHGRRRKWYTCPGRYDQIEIGKALASFASSQPRLYHADASREWLAQNLSTMVGDVLFLCLAGCGARFGDQQNI